MPGWSEVTDSIPPAVGVSLLAIAIYPAPQCSKDGRIASKLTPTRATQSARRFLRLTDTTHCTQLGQRVGAGLRCFLALVHEVLEEELLMLFASVEVMRGQDHREHRHFGFQLNLHQRTDHRLCDELMAIDPAIDHQTGSHDATVSTGVGQQFCVQRDFKRAAYLEKVDIAFGIAVGRHFADKALARLIDDIFVPASLNESDALMSVNCGGLHLF